MRKLILLTVLFGSLNTSGQDHLEPNNGLFSELDIMRDYYVRVIEILGDGLTHRPDAQLIIIPSFSKEVIWQIYHDEGTEKYTAIFRTGTESIWYNQFEEEPKEIEPITKEIELSKQTAELIIELFNTAIYDVKFPKNDRMGFDGQNYYFSTFEYSRGIRSGTIWSPDRDTKMDELVKIGRELTDVTEHEQQPASELLNRIEQLTAKLKETAR